MGGKLIVATASLEAYFQLMSTLTIPISDENLSFLHEWTKENGMTPESFFAAHVDSLRRPKRRPIHPDVIRATGVIQFEGDPREAYLEHMEKKHA